MSARKNYLPPFLIITDGDMSQASLTSEVVNIQYMDNVCIQLVWTGSPTGTFALQGSNTYTQNPNDGSQISAGTWTTISLNPTIAASGSASNALLDLNQLSFPWLRIVYTKTSGTGTLNVTVSGKML